jgi:DNA-binding beta-propeller fold protein YncE
MSLKHLGFIDLPAHLKAGGFDHAAIHRESAKLYVAHTANDSLDVIDCRKDCYSHSITNLPGVAGALVSDEHDLIFTSNRGENTVGIFQSSDEHGLLKIPCGVRPNGLAYDAKRGSLLAANVGDPAIPNSFTLSIIDVKRESMIASIPVSGRTRWVVFDAEGDCFYVNIADPPQIVVIESGDPTRISKVISIPAAGPHGLDLDAGSRRLFCACDAGKLVVLDADSGKVISIVEISGAPDVIFFNAALEHLYVAIGDPGVIDVIATREMKLSDRVSTEKGAHTIAFDPDRNKIYAFLPQTHRAGIYSDEG